jgi:predicted dehydrogenase
MDQMIHAAIVGLGMWGRSLVRSVQGKSDDIRFDAACTRTAASGADACAEFGLRQVTDYDRLLADPGIDAVVLATPNAQHADQMERAARAGKHVFVEKPFTLDMASARSALAALRAANLTVGIGYTRRFHPAMLQIKQWLKEGRLGTLVSMVGQQSTMMAPFLGKHWRVDPAESPAGAMTAHSVHTIDSMMQLAGPIATVHCISEQRASAIEDTTSLMLKFANGGTGMVFGTMSSARFARFAVYGSKGLAEVSGSRLEELEWRAAPTEPPTGPSVSVRPERHEYPPFDMLNAELVAFAKCIMSGTAFAVSDHDLLHGVAVMEAGIESARTGLPVQVKS